MAATLPARRRRRDRMTNTRPGRRATGGCPSCAGMGRLWPTARVLMLNVPPPPGVLAPLPAPCPCCAGTGELHRALYRPRGDVAA